MVQVAIAILVLLLVPSVAGAQSRIALIITNQAYAQAGARLTNTHRDGDVVKSALEKVAFKVWVVKDTGNEHALLQAIGEHVQRLSEAGPEAVGFFYYSGHGAADRPNGENYLIPTNVPLTHASQLPLMAVRLEKITATLANADRMSFVVFDACRNVPLQREQKELAFKGLVPVREQRGLLVAFATDPGNVAVDHSVYAKALADEIVKPGLEAGQVFRAVARRVLKDTQDKQSPEYLDKRLSDFHFIAAASVVDREVAALKEQLAKMESDLKREQEAGAGSAKEAVALKEALAKREAELKRREEEQKKQVAVAAPPKAPAPAKAPQETAAQSKKGEEAERLAAAKREEEKRKLEEGKRDADRLVASKAAEAARKQSEAASPLTWTTPSVKMATVPDAAKSKAPDRAARAEEDAAARTRGAEQTKDSTQVAVASPPAPGRSPLFDGTWLVTMTCPVAADGALGYERRFSAQVKNGFLHGVDGVRGKPGWLVISGAIEQSGAALIGAKGLTGQAANNVGRRPPGEPSTFSVKAQFEGSHGTGRRLETRPCGFTFAKQY